MCELQLLQEEINCLIMVNICCNCCSHIIHVFHHKHWLSVETFHLKRVSITYYLMAFGGQQGLQYSKSYYLHNWLIVTGHIMT